MKGGTALIESRTGDLLATDAEALVNTVNCVGHMGRGVALQFKKSWPANFHAYAAACQRQEVRPGRMFVFETGQLTNPRFIINLHEAALARQVAPRGYRLRDSWPWLRRSRGAA